MTKSSASRALRSPPWPPAFWPCQSHLSISNHPPCGDSACRLSLYPSAPWVLWALTWLHSFYSLPGSLRLVIIVPHVSRAEDLLRSAPQAGGRRLEDNCHLNFTNNESGAESSHVFPQPGHKPMFWWEAEFKTLGSLTGHSSHQPFLQNQLPYRDRSALSKDNGSPQWTSVCKGGVRQGGGGSLEHHYLQIFYSLLSTREWPNQRQPKNFCIETSHFTDGEIEAQREGGGTSSEILHRVPTPRSELGKFQDLVGIGDDWAPIGSGWRVRFSLSRTHISLSISYTSKELSMSPSH